MFPISQGLLRSSQAAVLVQVQVGNGYHDFDEYFLSAIEARATRLGEEMMGPKVATHYGSKSSTDLLVSHIFTPKMTTNSCTIPWVSPFVLAVAMGISAEMAGFGRWMQPVLSAT